MNLEQEFEKINQKLNELTELINSKQETAKEEKKISELPLLLTNEQVQELLDVTSQTLYNLRKKGELNAITKNNRVYFKKEEVMRYISQGEKFNVSKKTTKK